MSDIFTKLEFAKNLPQDSIFAYQDKMYVILTQGKREGFAIVKPIAVRDSNVWKAIHKSKQLHEKIPGLNTVNHLKSNGEKIVNPIKAPYDFTIIDNIFGSDVCETDAPDASV